MKALKVFLKIVPHALLVVTGMFITFLIIDSQNSIIGMIDSDLSKDVMWLWCALSLITAVTLIYICSANKRKRKCRIAGTPSQTRAGKLCVMRVTSAGSSVTLSCCLKLCASCAAVKILTVSFLHI